MESLSSRGCAFAYAIQNPEGDLLAEGSTAHVFTDASGRARRGSPEVIAVLERFRGSAE